MDYHRHRHTANAGLPARGTRVVFRGSQEPVMTVVRHTQFDNGEVECLWFTPDLAVQRAWLPADLLSPERVAFGERIRRKKNA